MYRSLLNCIEGLHRQDAIIVEVIESIKYALSDIIRSRVLRQSAVLPKLLWISRRSKRSLQIFSHLPQS